MLTTLCVPHSSIGILNKAYSEVTLMGLQVRLPGVESRDGDRGGLVREAGTEKTKWRSAVQAEGQTHRDKQVQISRSSVEVKVKHLRRPLMIIPKVSDTLFTFSVTDRLNYTRWAPAMTPCSSSRHSASISALKTNPLYRDKT